LSRASAARDPFFFFVLGFGVLTANFEWPPRKAATR
jgi:hypothetical protein